MVGEFIIKNISFVVFDLLQQFVCRHNEIHERASYVAFRMVDNVLLVEPVP